MFKKADNNALWAIGLSLVLFFIGGIITTVVPPLVDTSWSKPFENHDPAKGVTGKLVPLNEQQKKGRAIYVREGCWYCHPACRHQALRLARRGRPHLHPGRVRL